MATELPEEIGAQLSELESTIYGTKNQISFLNGGYKVLSEASTTAEKRLEAVDLRLNSMDSTLQAIMKSLEKLTSAIHGKAPM